MLQFSQNGYVWLSAGRDPARRAHRVGQVTRWNTCPLGWIFVFMLVLSDFGKYQVAYLYLFGIIFVE
ncbi:hypothetical protein CV_4316 [Chromobacterium violaceum ATCC 12472]|uniref:Uncharacterized protein n=1 Tax=Chromobacterium violaceum (strain ATCC 12472 / DSM 30191 / JCM 1249 / CCUG 213 / NBRC 12614 / NCIMB 9131 / NCTC 9757 / MK) TaxID=243365 RepID=Q7NQ25_CHRVO|nr:hypothetical protein CV_4316 [Chromobacterium violaceum ATCC 12472]